MLNCLAHTITLNWCSYKGKCGVDCSRRVSSRCWWGLQKWMRLTFGEFWRMGHWLVQLLSFGSAHVTKYIIITPSVGYSSTASHIQKTKNKQKLIANLALSPATQPLPLWWLGKYRKRRRPLKYFRKANRCAKQGRQIRLCVLADCLGRMRCSFSSMVYIGTAWFKGSVCT